MSKTYLYKPPAFTELVHLQDYSFLDSGNARDVGQHYYQVFDILSGSGTNANTPDQLHIVESSGSGPLYDITARYQTVTSNGDKSKIHPNDMLFITRGVAETGNIEHPLRIVIYRYDIQSVRSHPVLSHHVILTAKESVFNPDLPPATTPGNMYYYQEIDYDIVTNYKASAIVREVNQQFLIG